MQDKETKINNLRKKIDDIDSQIIDLINMRTEIVQEISKNKVVGPAIRTGREAEVLRKVLTKAPSNFSRRSIIRIWRELVSAYSQMQSSYSIGLCAPTHSVGYWDIARGYFGSASNIELYKSPKVLLQKISDDPSFIGVFPHPANDPETDWWKNIGVGSNKQTNIIARLPYGGKSIEQFEELEAIAVASFASEISGKDRSWLIFELNKKKSKDLLIKIARKFGILGDLLCQVKEDENIFIYLLDVEGFFEIGSKTFEGYLNNEDDVVSIRSIGSYAL
ncbi:MAG: hypothetical protein CFH01_01871 [Alphaproteobacteria bacterium MarineAlpha2_Bin1]|nr:MAG: hypothetical protein CFH01_01871 [Alphaproteobacteria bacterium MarineAlpha2_Bin1]|tara:strand:+ start:1810 stop:2640 length:831 start_codon:yes stop_codon:yes gene_type:complete